MLQPHLVCSDFEAAETMKLAAEFDVVAFSLVALDVHHFFDHLSNVKSCDDLPKDAFLNLGKTKEISHVKV